MASSRSGKPIRHNGYEYTNAIWASLGLTFLFFFIALAAVLGYVLRTLVFTSLGMISLLPLAIAIEVAKARTNHNLFPFEIVLY